MSKNSSISDKHNDKHDFFVKWHINLCRLFNAKSPLQEEQ